MLILGIERQSDIGVKHTLFSHQSVSFAVDGTSFYALRANY